MTGATNRTINCNAAIMAGEHMGQTNVSAHNERIAKVSLLNNLRNLRIIGVASSTYPRRV
jgi:hypothetical protein